MTHAAVYRTDSAFHAHYLAEALNEAGIPSFVDNANSMLAFGEVGMFPVHVRIRDQARLAEANRIVEFLVRSIPKEERADARTQAWKCNCGQPIGGRFTACWRCGTERPV